jgi:hypothetical protein
VEAKNIQLCPWLLGDCRYLLFLRARIEGVFVKVYVAGPWKHRKDAAEAAGHLAAAGHEIVSRWHGLAWAEDTDDVEILCQEARNDWDDISQACVMVVLNIEKSEGKAVEQGIAMMRGIPIILVGSERFNVFQYLPMFTLVQSLATALKLMEIWSSVGANGVPRQTVQTA